MGLNEVLESRDMEAAEACNMAVYASVDLMDHVYDEIQWIQDENLREYSPRGEEAPGEFEGESLVEKETAAVELLEDYFAPVLQYLHADAERPDFADPGNMREVLRGYGFENSGASNILNYEPGLEDLDKFYESLDDKLNRKDYDQVLGVYSSALPFVYLTDHWLDTGEEPAFCRFSHHSRDDSSVLWTPEMLTRFDPEGNDILLIDDSWDSGRTGRRVTEEFAEEASLVTLLAHSMRYRGDTLRDTPVEMEIRKEKKDGVLVGRDLEKLRQKNF
ncbi:MAG: hypothetical protein ABEK10_00935 [Candidatus Nanosalina sp.]